MVYLRRIMLLLSAIVISWPIVIAETHYKPHISVGAKGGMTYSKMSFYPSVKQSMLPGMIIGATFSYAEEKIFGLTAELCIEQRGWKENFEEANEQFNYSRRLTYIQLPLLTHISFGSSKFKGYVNLGPEIAYMIGSSISANFDYRNYQSVAGFPVQNRMNEQMTMAIKNKFDYGISGGLGMEYFVNRRHSVTIEGRFYYGLGNIFPDKKKDTFSASRGMSIQVTLGYNLRLK